MKKILVIGSLNLDMVTNVDHMPAVGETILCPSMQLIPGGKGANQACAAASLGYTSESFFVPWFFGIVFVLLFTESHSF